MRKMAKRAAAYNKARRKLRGEKDDDAKMPATYHGKSMRPGGGGRFAKGKDALEAKGMSEKRASAIMASRGRAKYGSKIMAAWSAAGRKRAA